MAEFNQMSLRQCGEYDARNGAKTRLTGWGYVCKDRERRGISRRIMRLKKQGFWQPPKEKE